MKTSSYHALNPFLCCEFTVNLGCFLVSNRSMTSYQPMRNKGLNRPMFIPNMPVAVCPALSDLGQGVGNMTPARPPVCDKGKMEDLGMKYISTLRHIYIYIYTYILKI